MKRFESELVEFAAEVSALLNLLKKDGTDELPPWMRGTLKGFEDRWFNADGDSEQPSPSFEPDPDPVSPSMPKGYQLLSITSSPNAEVFDYGLRFNTKPLNSMLAPVEGLIEAGWFAIVGVEVSGGIKVLGLEEPDGRHRGYVSPVEARDAAVRFAVEDSEARRLVEETR